MKGNTTFNKEAAEKLAGDRGFKPENMLFCPECGRTVVRTQKLGNPGFKDKIFCTCDSTGYPMFPVVDEEEDDD